MATNDLPANYQNIPQVLQLWAARVDAVNYDMGTRLAAIDKKLAFFGLTPDP
jgi:hypothetical protein